ncbi:hypothetical protein [Nocardia sp. NPDC055049]
MATEMNRIDAELQALIFAVRVAGMAIRGHRVDGVWPKAGVHQA